jgi:hypothetical protein
VPDGSVDAVFVGEAFHWFGTTAACCEIARVLAARGGPALLWNGARWSEAELSWLPAFRALVSRCRARRTRTRPRARGGARRSTRAACSRRCRERTPTTSTGSPPTTSSPSWPPRAGSRTCPATGVTRCSHGCGRSSPAGRRSRCATAPGCTDAGPAGGGQAREPAPQKNGPAVCRTVMSQPSRRRRSSRSAGRCATFTIRCAVPSLSRRRKTTS